MGNIEVLKKWSLEESNWVMPKFPQYGRSFAIASYDAIINNPSEGINYIIIDQGSRVEDHSKDFKTIKEKEVRIDNVLKYYGNKNENYDIKLFLMDADAPIIEDAKLFASYIDSLASRPNTISVNVIGLSKGSAMNFYVPRFFRQKETFLKTNMFNVASPYTGTKLASPLVFYPEVKELITSHIGDNALANLVYKGLINVYESISSNSHMDYDIAIPGEIPQDKINVYDPTFIQNIFVLENVEAIKRLQTFKNITTGIDSDTLKEALRTANVVGIGLCLLDDLFFQNKSDGMVYTDAQRKVEDVLDINSYHISTHHDVNGNIRAFNEVLGIVDDTIMETEEQKRVLKKKGLLFTANTKD